MVTSEKDLLLKAKNTTRNNKSFSVLNAIIIP